MICAKPTSKALIVLVSFYYDEMLFANVARARVEVDDQEYGVELRWSRGQPKMPDANVRRNMTQHLLRYLERHLGLQPDHYEVKEL